MADNGVSAMAARSLRTVRTELEFLSDLNIISQQQLSSILALLPDKETPRTAQPPTPSQLPIQNLQMNEKLEPVSAAIPSPAPPYRAPQGPVRLCEATALYAYPATDPGDLALLPNDKIDVQEYVNQDWWRGQSQRTKQVGIFPRNYVQPSPEPSQNAFGQPVPVNGFRQDNEQLQPSQPGQPSKAQEQGKKMGKKIGNAALFGAGATIGSKIVNGIF